MSFHRVGAHSLEIALALRGDSEFLNGVRVVKTVGNLKVGMNTLLHWEIATSPWEPGPERAANRKC